MRLQACWSSEPSGVKVIAHLCMSAILVGRSAESKLRVHNLTNHIHIQQNMVLGAIDAHVKFRVLPGVWLGGRDTELAESETVTEVQQLELTSREIETYL